MARLREQKGPRMRLDGIMLLLTVWLGRRPFSFGAACVVTRLQNQPALPDRSIIGYGLPEPDLFHSDLR